MIPLCRNLSLTRVLLPMSLAAGSPGKFTEANSRVYEIRPKAAGWKASAGATVHREPKFLRVRNENHKMLSRLADFIDSSTCCDCVEAGRAGKKRNPDPLLYRA